MTRRFDWTLPEGFLHRPDTMLHGTTSAALALALAIQCASRGVHVLWAFGVVWLIGVIKELVWDLWLGNGDPQFTDLIGNVVGLLGAFVVVSSV